MTTEKELTIAERIRSNFKLLTVAERQLANHLMSDFPMAGLCSITEFAEGGKVSSPTVLRMIKKIGFSGFPEFQKKLRDELSETLSNPITKHDRLLSDAPETHILNRFATASMDNLLNTLEQIDHNSFDMISELLADTRHQVHIHGGRISHSIANYLFTHLQVIRPGVSLLPGANSLWPHHLLNMQQGDVLVIFDIRRYEVDATRLAKLAVQRGACIVLFTDQWMSPVAAWARLTIQARIEAPSGWDSALVTLFLVESLIASVENQLWPSVTDRMNQLESLLNATERFQKSP